MAPPTDLNLSWQRNNWVIQGQCQWKQRLLEDTRYIKWFTIAYWRDQCKPHQPTPDILGMCQWYVQIWMIPAIDEVLIWARRTKFITTARKSILKLVKLQSLVTKCCKMRKIWHFKCSKFCILLYCVQKFAPLSAQKWCTFLHIIQKHTKFAKFAGLYSPHYTTFRDQTLQFYQF